jgi:DNA-binding CsgD family transcriptional regulator
MSLSHSSEHPLTRRETEVLQSAADGSTAIDTGSSLGISARTVNGHRAGAAKRLQAVSITHAVAIALRKGLID